MKRSIPADQAFASQHSQRGRWHRCCWPECYKRPSEQFDVPLCNLHVSLAAADVVPVRQERWRDPTGLWAMRIDELQAEVNRLRTELAHRPPVAPEPSRKPAPKAGTIYYVQVGAHIKIGWTANLDTRMRDFPPNSQLLATHAGTRKDEAALHKRFAVWRSHGREWYPLAPVLLEHIKRTVNKHGEPAEIAFGARPVEVLRASKTKQVTKPRPKWGRARHTAG